MFPGDFGVPELIFPLQWKYSNENKILMIFSNKTPWPLPSLLSLSPQSCGVVLVMLRILRKLSSRNNNINGVNKWSVIIKRAGGGQAAS